MTNSLWSFLLGGTPGGDGGLVWTQPAWVVALALTGALLAWWLAWWPRNPGASAEVRRRRTLERILWGLALGALVVALAEPVWVDEKSRTEPGDVVVLVDGSASMAIEEGGGQRGDAVADILQAVRPTQIFTFDSDIRTGLDDSWQGDDTDLGMALDAVADRYLGRKARAVVVITDGLDRGALRRTLREDPTATPPHLPGPVTIYQVGEQRELFDVAIEDVVTGGFAFLRTPFTLTAQLRGPPGQRIRVELSREGRLVTGETILLDEEGLGQVEFESTPQKVGRFTWEISTPVLPGDAVPGNNSYSVVVRVVRDRTRVMQVSGSPSYDQ
ncbi:MAG: VWA domain-containing protein, partial [Myxococcota bacterium]|nr:VWA domain-containing protein [Myxococcota bacterium]